MSEDLSQINLIWKITDMERQLSDGYVFTVYWELSSDLIETGSVVSGSIGLEKPDNLINYEDLTEELVISWVKSALGEVQVNNLETNLRKHVQSLNSQPTNSNGIPWETLD